MYNTYLFDGHGHSRASDGNDSPEAIIDSAIKKGINILALTDHNTTANLPRFIEYGKTVNKNGTKILLIPGMEISCSEGDLLMYFVDEVQADAVCKNFKKPTSRPKIQETIEQYADEYNAYFILPHPQSFYISSVSIPLIESLLTNLNQEHRQRVGIEVYNWMSQIFIWRRAAEERAVRKSAKALNVAAFGGTDYHSAQHVGNGHTIMYMEKLNMNSFTNAFREKRTQAKLPHPITLTELMQLSTVSLLAEINSNLFNPSFRIPKN